LGHDRAEATDGESFDPGYQERDYQKVAEMLPVFCVSSKAYLKLSGWLKEDDPISGFPTTEDTKIPTVREHALKITESARTARLQRFYAKMHEYLNELLMHVGVSNRPMQLSLQHKQQEMQFLNMIFANLSKVDLHSMLTTIFVLTNIAFLLRNSTRRSSQASANCGQESRRIYSNASPRLQRWRST